MTANRLYRESSFGILEKSYRPPAESDLHKSSPYTLGQMNRPKTVVLHEDKFFEHALIPLDGNSYHRCKFHRCTLLFNGHHSLIDCEIAGCAWQINVCVSDQPGTDELTEFINRFVYRSVPLAPGEETKQ
jgi:hypothetical protein